MWAPGLFLGIFALLGATVVLLYSGLFVIGIPLFVIGVIAIGVLDFKRRRHRVADIKHLRDQAKTEGVEFTERDRQTLAT
jgi:hypothetical protein